MSSHIVVVMNSYRKFTVFVAAMVATLLVTVSVVGEIGLMIYLWWATCYGHFGIMAESA